MDRFLQYSDSEVTRNSSVFTVCRLSTASSQQALTKSVLLTKDEILAVNEEAGCTHYNTEENYKILVASLYKGGYIIFNGEFFLFTTSIYVTEVAKCCSFEVS